MQVFLVSRVLFLLRVQILGLIIARRGVKPAVVMKAPSGTFAFIGSAVIVMTVFGCCICPPTGQLFDIKIGDPEYVPLKVGRNVEHDLQAALARIKGHNGVCDITFLRHDGGQPDPDYCKHIDVSLKTDRVIKSEFASNGARDISTANDPNLMHRIASPYPSDITGVLNLLKPQ